MGSIEQLSLADFRAIMETNCFGVIRCIQAVLPGMRVRQGGCIINMASVTGHVAHGVIHGVEVRARAIERMPGAPESFSPARLRSNMISLTLNDSIDFVGDEHDRSCGHAVDNSSLLRASTLAGAFMSLQAPARASICRALIRRDYADRARPCDDDDHLRDSIDILFGAGTERAKHLRYGDSK
jgi:NAD(P)-dependent dehydrogenase (short-subunit alcohol dehydrogenase family)